MSNIHRSQKATQKPRDSNNQSNDKTFYSEHHFCSEYNFKKLN